MESFDSKTVRLRENDDEVNGVLREAKAGLVCSITGVLARRVPPRFNQHVMTEAVSA